MKSSTSKPISPFGIRMENEIKQWVEDRARHNGRSMNSEIIQILKQVKENSEQSTASQGNYELRSN